MLRHRVCLRSWQDITDPVELLKFLGARLDCIQLGRQQYLQNFKRALLVGLKFKDLIGTRKRDATRELQQLVAYIQQSSGLSYPRWNRL